MSVDIVNAANEFVRIRSGRLAAKAERKRLLKLCSNKDDATGHSCYERRDTLPDDYCAECFEALRYHRQYVQTAKEQTRALARLERLAADPAKVRKKQPGGQPLDLLSEASRLVFVAQSVRGTPAMESRIDKLAEALEHTLTYLWEKADKP
jgi:hypothetical protein